SAPGRPWPTGRSTGWCFRPPSPSPCRSSSRRRWSSDRSRRTRSTASCSTRAACCGSASTARSRTCAPTARGGGSWTGGSRRWTNCPGWADLLPEGLRQTELVPVRILELGPPAPALLGRFLRELDAFALQVLVGLPDVVGLEHQVREASDPVLHSGR